MSNYVRVGWYCEICGQDKRTLPTGIHACGGTPTRCAFCGKSKHDGQPCEEIPTLMSIYNAPSPVPPSLTREAVEALDRYTRGVDEGIMVIVPTSGEYLFRDDVLALFPTEEP